MTKIYFLVPGGATDCPPDGPIALGNIINDPRTPELAINAPLSKIVKGIAVSETCEFNTSRELKNEISFKPSVWAKFVNLFHAGDIGTETKAIYSNTDKSIYKFDKVVTKRIAPDDATVKLLFEEPSVQRNITDSSWEQKLFLITGVQVVYGAEITREKGKERSTDIKTGADLTPAGVPFSVGVALEASRTPSQSYKTTKSADYPFVFAYRLSQIIYKRKVVERRTEYHRGDLLHLDDKWKDGDQSEPDNFIVEFGKLEEESELIANEFDLTISGAVEAADEECLVAYEQGEDSIWE